MESDGIAVILVDCAGGGELAAVRELLSGPLSTPSVLIGPDDLGKLPLALDLRSRVLRIGNAPVSPAVVWTRHVAASAILSQVRRPDAMSVLAAECWSGFFSVLAGAAPAALPGAPPTRVAQLLDAERLGVTVPRTALAADAGTAGMAGSRVLVKTPDFRLYEPDRANWPANLPVVLDPADGQAAHIGGQHPQVVQEYVAHVQELRVYYLDGGICAFEVRMDEPARLWVDPDAVTVSAVACPSSAAEVVQRLASAWGLGYGAFDLLMSDDGEPVFLEVNPDGDWLWYERKARWHGVTFMAAVMVREWYLRTANGTDRVAGHVLG